MSIQEKIYRYFEQYEDLHVLFMFDPNGVHRMELMGAEWPENYGSSDISSDTAVM